MELPFVLFDLFFGVLARGEERTRRRREKERALDALRRVAEALGGRLHRPWFGLGHPRVLARLDGRDVQVVWLGDGEVEVSGPAPDILDVWARRAGFFGRLFGARGGVYVGGASTDHHEAARRLVESSSVDRLEARHGRIVARGKPGADATAILGLTDWMMAMAWTPVSTVEVRVRALPPRVAAPPPRIKLEPAAPTVAAASGEPLRCPYCHDALAPQGVVVHCASCDAPHHPTCFEEGGGCSIAGCAQRAARGVRTRA